MNKVFKGLLIITFTMFLSLYFSRNYSSYTGESIVLSDEAIDRFEKDLKNGVDINPKNYLPVSKDYNNKVSELGLKVSNIIELSFKKSIKFIVRYLDE